jgi:GTP pyrophosphokinase
MAQRNTAARLSTRFEDALKLANRLHLKQVRKGTDIPYMAHLLGVASIALEHGADEDEAIAAVLHDAVEDQGGQPTLTRIRKRFGPRVAGIVEGCTDADTIPKPPWKQRKTRYIEHLHQAKPSVLLVSAADKLHNARSILGDFREHGEALWDRFAGGRDGTLWYYRELVTAFGNVGAPKRLLEELNRVVSELESLANRP